MDIYQKGFNIKQTTWCIKKQSGYKTISEVIMKEFDKLA
jgi:hypothetical protein